MNKWERKEDPVPYYFIENGGYGFGFTNQYFSSNEQTTPRSGGDTFYCLYVSLTPDMEKICGVINYHVAEDSSVVSIPVGNPNPNFKDKLSMIVTLSRNKDFFLQARGLSHSFRFNLEKLLNSLLRS